MLLLFVNLVFLGSQQPLICHRARHSFVLHRAPGPVVFLDHSMPAVDSRQVPAGVLLVTQSIVL